MGEQKTSDCISRQAAIDALTHKWNGMVTSVFDVINSLPPALPDLDEWCTDCKEYDKERNSCPRWNRVIEETLKDLQEERKTQLSEESTTFDCISRQAAIDALDGNVMVTSRESAQAVMDYIRGCADRIRALPSAQPEAKPPKWVAEDRYVKNIFAIFPHCPQCNADVTTGQCYCMICGQHIDWSEDNE